jgi:[ribosomal protein S5]-alanine N-acetyltransferase
MVSLKRSQLALPTLTTERLIVRLAEPADRDALIAYYQNNNGHLAPFSPLWPEDFFTKGFWERQINQNVEEFLTDVSARMFVFEKAEPGPVIGNVSLGGILRSAAQFGYLGYGIAQDKQGQGMMAEAVQAIIDLGFGELNLHRIMANYVPTNERSGKLLRRLGFTVEGYARDYLNLNGRWQDHILTSLTNPHWQAPPVPQHGLHR